jgi:flavin reductase (DIM6/NTAB) family NADH-FMN oxidoreductase RutF
MATSEIAELFRRITAGVYVIGVAGEGGRDAFTAAWVMQVSFDPPLLALSIHPEHASYPLLHSGRGFTVSVLREGQEMAARHFGLTSGRERDKLAGVRWRPGARGAPILEEALAWFECELVGGMPSGDHELVVGRVADGRLVAPDARPLIYASTGDMDGSSRLFPEELTP